MRTRFACLGLLAVAALGGCASPLMPYQISLAPVKDGPESVLLLRSIPKGITGEAEHTFGPAAGSVGFFFGGLLYGTIVVPAWLIGGPFTVAPDAAIQGRACGLDAESVDLSQFGTLVDGIGVDQLLKPLRERFPVSLQAAGSPTDDRPAVRTHYVLDIDDVRMKLKWRINEDGPLMESRGCTTEVAASAEWRLQAIEYPDQCLRGSADIHDFMGRLSFAEWFSDLPMRRQVLVEMIDAMGKQIADRLEYFSYGYGGYVYRCKPDLDGKAR